MFINYLYLYLIDGTLWHIVLKNLTCIINFLGKYLSSPSFVIFIIITTTILIVALRSRSYTCFSCIFCHYIPSPCRFYLETDSVFILGWSWLLSRGLNLSSSCSASAIAGVTSDCHHNSLFTSSWWRFCRDFMPSLDYVQPIGMCFIDAS